MSYIVCFVTKAFVWTMVHCFVLRIKRRVFYWNSHYFIASSAILILRYHVIMASSNTNKRPYSSIECQSTFMPSYKIPKSNISEQFGHEDLLRIFRGKNVLFIGDSTIRAIYRDMQPFLHKNKLLSQDDLRKNYQTHAIYESKLRFIQHWKSTSWVFIVSMNFSLFPVWYCKFFKLQWGTRAQR